jgi:ribosome modulation factor
MSTTTRVERANEYGYEAGIEGAPEKNPYGEGCDQHRAWEAGYEQGAQDRREIQLSNG